MTEYGNPYLESVGARRPFVMASQGSNLTERAELTIGGVVWNDWTRDLQVDNSGDEGGSVLTLISARPLKRRIDDEVVLTLDGKPYFTGTLKRPGEEGGSRWEKSAVALGPFAEMAGQWFTEQVAYANFTIRGALLDIFARASTVSGYGDVLGGDNITVAADTGDYTKNTTLSEGARDLIGPANFVLLDKQNGEKFAMRKPRPGTAGREVAFYSPDDYAEGDFTVDWEATQPYVKVDVYRLADDNSYEVRALRDVMVEGIRRDVKRNRWWFVEDFPGSQEEADAEATQLAMELMNTGKFSLTVRLEPEPWRYDGFTGQRVIEEEEGLVLETLDLVSTDGLSADFTNELVTFTGDALRRSSESHEDGTRDVPGVLHGANPYLDT